MISRLSVLAAAIAMVASGQDAFPIASIRVEGNSRFDAATVIRASGLAVNQPATPKDFETACNRLIDTGIFQSARYLYKPAAQAYELTLVVGEASDLYEIRIDIPGVDEAQAWAWLEQNEPLVRRQGPTSTAALDYYTRAIGKFLATQERAQDIAARLRADPNTGAVVAIFRPAVLGNVAAVRFEGNQAVPSAELEKAIAPALGAGFTEQDFRELLDLNVRPLYEQQGRYRVQFPGIAIDGGAVTVTVSEGPVFRLGIIEVAGERLPVPPEELVKLVPVKPGEVPNWRKISQGASAIAQTLGRFGYLDANCTPDRHLDDANGRIDVIFSVEKGQLYVFGELRFKGLDPAGAARARSLWKLTPGAPLNLEYLDQYEALLMRDDKIRFARISRRYDPRPGTSVADVTFTFRQ